MTAMMREWIVETTKDELRLALDWKKNEALLQSRGEHALGTEDAIRIKIEDGAEILPQSMLEPPREYFNDGSNFHISLYCGPGSARTVQIASFLEFQEPVSAELSDTESVIVAVFSKAATSKFKREKLKAFTEGTKGGVLVIRKGKLIVTPHGSLTRQVHLWIEDFFFRGSSGSDTFGHPKPILSAKWKDQIKLLIKDLFAVLHEKSIKDSSEQDLRLEPFEKGLDDETTSTSLPTLMTTDADDFVSNSQAPYLTQNPMVEAEPRPTEETDAIGGQDLKLILRNPHSTSATSASEENRKRSAKLLDALKPKSESKPNPDLDNLGKEELGTPQQSHMEPVRSALSSRRSQDQEQTAPGSSPPVGFISLGKSEAIREGSIDEWVGSALESELLQTTKTSERRQSPKPMFTKQNSAYEIFHSGSFKVVKNAMLSRQTFAEQEKILHLPGSWAHPAPGHHFPPANIPVALLARFNALVESRSSKGEEHLETDVSLLISNEQVPDPTSHSTKTVPSDFVSSQSSEGDESDDDISWSTSPQRPSPSPAPPGRRSPLQLPPDSSLPILPLQNSLAKLSQGSNRHFRVPSHHSDGSDEEMEYEEPRALEAIHNSDMPLTSRNKTSLSNDSTQLPVSSSGSRGTHYGHGMFSNTAMSGSQDTSIPVEVSNRSVQDSVSMTAHPQGLALAPVSEVVSLLSSPPSSPPKISGHEPSTLPVDQNDQSAIAEREPEQATHVHGNPIAATKISGSVTSPQAVSMGIVEKHNSSVKKRKARSSRSPSTCANPSKKRRTEEDAILLEVSPIEQLVEMIEDPADMARKNRREALATLKKRREQIKVPAIEPATRESPAGHGSEGHDNHKLPAPSAAVFDHEPVNAWNQESNKPVTESSSNLSQVQNLVQIQSSIQEPNTPFEQVHGIVEVEHTPTKPHDYKNATPHRQVDDGRLSGMVTVIETSSKPQRSGTLDTPNAITPVLVDAYADLHRRFSNAYPSYDGDLRHFKALCNRARSSQHPFMWDDFVVRHRLDYAKHTTKSNEEGSDPIPYEQYYRDEVPDPAYTKRILTKTVLDSVHPCDIGSARTAPVTPVIFNSSEWHFGHQGQSPNQAQLSTYRHQYDSTPMSGTAAPGRLDGNTPRHSLALPYDEPPLEHGNIPNHLSMSSERMAQSKRYWPQQEPEFAVRSSAFSEPGARNTMFPSSSAPLSSRVHPVYTSRSANSKPIPTVNQRQTQEMELETHASKVSNNLMALAGSDSSPLAASISPPPLGRVNMTAATETTRTSPMTSVDDVIMSVEADPSQENEWWLEDDTPFKEFARQYANLRLVQAATPTAASSIDVLGWSLP